MPLLAVFISLVSVFISPSAVYAGQAYLGVDTCDEVTDRRIEQATNILGHKPAFWGRYFNGLKHLGDSCEYRLTKETSVLRDAGIRVLPVARATTDVGGSYSLGYTNGKQHAGDFVESFRNLDGQYVIFLDVESDRSLSTEYYQGWSEAIASYCPHEGDCSSNVQLLPGVYLSAGDKTTSENLQDAIRGSQSSQGSQCGGLWIADWRGSVATEWSSYYASPASKVDCRVLFWQDDNINQTFDADLSNPDYDALNYLVLP